MPENIIPDHIRQFIYDYIETIAQLEGLLLFRNNPALQIRSEEIAQRLYINNDEARIFLNQLVTRGLLEKSDNMYTYKPASVALKDMVDQIADYYARYLVPLTNLIHSKSKNKVQKFADAFKIRKDNKDG